jgi:prepilin-type N-terminal cleavage/methylation domain-containing protein
MAGMSLPAFLSPDPILDTAINASCLQHQPSRQHGFSLPEVCVVCALLGIAATLAAPSFQQWQWRAKTENTAQGWAADLQTARLQAMRTGQALQLQRLNNCSSAPLANGDWRCGWELVNPSNTNKDNPTPILSNALGGELSVVLAPAQNFLPINAQGEPVVGGLRVVIRPLKNSTVVRSLCINTAGRLRMVNAASCS